MTKGLFGGLRVAAGAGDTATTTQISNSMDR
jgi:hypothetical protein